MVATAIGERESIARFYPKGTIISNGLSKRCGAGGQRGVAGAKLPLHRATAPHGVDYAADLSQEIVTARIDDAVAILLDHCALY